MPFSSDTTQTNEIEVKYIHPVYGRNPVYIKHEGNIIKGFSNGIKASLTTLKARSYFHFIGILQDDSLYTQKLA